MPAIHHWQNQFDRNDSDLEDTFKALGMEWKDKLKTIVMNGIFTLHLTDEQKDEFNRLFSRLFVRSGLANGNEMSSSVARLAINICRIMEVVAMLRAMEQGEITASPYVSPDPHTATDNLKDHIVSRWDLLIASDDFHAVLSLAESLYRHTTHILSFLPNTEVTSRGNADRDALVDSMEEEFTRASFLQKAGEMGIKSETASTWLKRMQKHGLVENVEWQGKLPEPKSDIQLRFTHAYVCEAKGWMNLCTKCTNLTFTLPGLTFTPSNLRFKALPVQPLSAAPGQAYKSGNGKNHPRRKVRHANRDKGLSSVSVCGRQPPDKDWDNRFGPIRYARMYV